MRHRIDRGLLLRILLSYFPQEISHRMLQVALEAQRGSPISDTDFAFSLEYLVQGGYVIKQALHSRKPERAIYKISNEGIRLVKGTGKEDPEILL